MSVLIKRRWCWCDVVLIVYIKERVSRHDNDGASADRRSGAHVPEPRSRRDGVDHDDTGDYAHALLGEGGKQPQRHQQPVTGM